MIRAPGACIPGAVMLLIATHPATASAQLSVQVSPLAGCPGQSWFEEALRQRQLQGQVRATFQQTPSDGSFQGEIEARSPDGTVIQRRLTGPRCQTVADALLLVAEVHLTPPAPAPAPTPPASAAPSARFAVALGLLGTADTAVTDGPSFAGGVSAWLSGRPRELRGLALSLTYGQKRVDGAVPVQLTQTRARLDLLPVQLSLGPTTALAPALSLAGGALRAEADLASSTPGTRQLWLASLGPRLRQQVGPLFADLDLAATLTLTRRRFVITGLDAPVASLPLLGASVSLSVGVPLWP